MIPVRLTLKNFMSYGEEGATLDFAGLHVACLSGDNGNGKSALLDAITYALWGKTRASGSQASSEDDLVRLGAEEADVSLDFRLGEDVYRARRRRNRRTRSGDWQILQQDPMGDWHPMGGVGARETEKKVIQLLRMDYETFLNSAYFQQGRADEFTRQKPDARKRILTEVLELQRFDRLEQMAKTRRDEANLQLKELEGEMRHLEARLAEEPQLREQLEALEGEAAKAAAIRDDCLAAARNHRDRFAILEERAALGRRLRQQAEEAQRETLELDARLRQVTSLIEADRALLGVRPALEEEFKRLEAARRLVAETDDSAARSAALERELHEVSARIQLARQSLMAEISAADKECRQVEGWKGELAQAERILTEIAPQIALFEAAEKERQSLRSALEKAEERFTELKAKSQRNASDIEETTSILALLDRPKPACPICSTDLSGGKHQSVVTMQRGKLKTLNDLAHEIRKDGQAAKQERDDLRKRIDAMEEKGRAEAALRSRKVEVERTRDTLCKRIDESGDPAGRLETLSRRLADEDFAKEEQARLVSVDREISAMRDLLAGRAEAERAVRELTAAGVEARWARAGEAEKLLAEREAELGRLSELLVKKREQSERDRAQSESHAKEAGDVEAARSALETAEAAARAASADHEAARGRADRVRHALEDIARAAEMLASRKLERDKLAKDAQAFTELVAAFGKKGVQAVIIESMLPEIEDEANRLLSRLTDNAMQVAITTQRQARSGSHQIETLDIQITDDAGTRPYELYSGGEAFRVNFALRIALSRLLARRSGARLQTLIIDEGFGSQDVKGRERLVEAIEAVKDEFALILVISHIEELKDAFQQRIEVTKTPEGSRLTLI